MILSFSVTWQMGLVEREINEILKGITQQQRPTANARVLARNAQIATNEDVAAQGQSVM